MSGEALSLSIFSMMLVSSLLLLLLSTITMADHRYGFCGHCAVETLVDTNEGRIPSKITEWHCRHPGHACGPDFNTKVSFDFNVKSSFVLNIIFWWQCRQLTGLLDVGYTRQIGNQEMVVHKRNLTVGIGCVCKTMEIQKFIQPERVDHRFWKNWS